MNENFKKITDKLKIVLFILTMAFFFVVGLLFFARPKVSETEKRELTKFPEFSAEAFLSGEWTANVSLWYADTYPFREGMIQANYLLESLYGLRDEVISEEAYVINGVAYQYYAFDKTQSDKYAEEINKLAASVEGHANVYDMVVPLHYQVSPLTDELMSKNPNASDGKENIDYIYSKLSGSVKTVDALGEMTKHNRDYLYFRTDHHWTARGAYYAYVAFCNKKGIMPTPLSDYEKLEFYGFLGTLYSNNGQPQDMKDNPDFVEAFVPKGTNTITVTERDGKVRNYSIVNKQTDTWYPAAGTKYNCFIAGDNPISEIHNPDKNDGSSIVIIKESYGNAFVPFLVDSYEHVYVIDYRYWSGDLATFVIDNGIDDVLFLNVINITSTKDRIDELSSIIH